MQKQKKELVYDVTLFKLEGHTTWRMIMSGSLAHEISGGAKITETKKIRIDRITGEIEIK